jgi:hypothetical protein
VLGIGSPHVGTISERVSSNSFGESESLIVVIAQVVAEQLSILPVSKPIVVSLPTLLVGRFVCGYLSLLLTLSLHLGLATVNYLLGCQFGIAE